MSTPPAEPNKPLIKSAGHVRQLEAEIAAWKQLTQFIADHVVAPLPKAGYAAINDYQRDVVFWIRAAISVPNDGPEGALEFLQAHWPEPPYEVGP